LCRLHVAEPLLEFAFRRSTLTRAVMVFGRAVALLLALALPASGLEALRSSLNAMACCTKTHNQCAGVRTPDDCCRGMGHTIAPSPSVAPNSRADVSLALVPVLPTVVPAAWIAPSAGRIVEPAFKRPHDPPHLHPVPLLI
jgi:hypothetical protein